MGNDSGAGPLGVQLLIIFILTLVNAFFAASEIAFVSINQGKMQRSANEGDKQAKRVVRLLEEPDNFLATIQVAITLAGFFSSASAATSFVERLEPLFGGIPAANSIALVVVTLILSYFTLVFGELYPKQLALQVPEEIARRTAGIILVIQMVFRPFIWMLSASTSLLKHITPIEFKNKEEKLTRGEMKLLLTNSRNDGAIDLDEFTMMQGVLSLDTKLAREVMVPRTDTTMLDVDDSIEENLEVILSCPYSRLPIYREDKDNVIGIIHTKDVLKASREKGFESINLEEIMNKALFVPAMIFIDDLLIEFRKEHQHMAVLRDEYGGVEGIVTLEDLLEEIVGEIEDEYDEQSEEFQKLADGRYLIDGKLPIEDFGQIFNELISSDEVDTMAGFVLEELGFFPDENEEQSVEVEVGSHILKPVEIENGRIKKIEVYEKPKEEEVSLNDISEN